jgi:RNA polymerase I-specific transcription initiation factor RRN3
VHVDYIKSLLQLARYAPELKGEVLALVTERLVKIDVQIQVDMEDLEDDIEESLIKEMKRKKQNEEDSEDDASDSSDSDSSDETSTPEERRQKELIESVKKMDAILDILFEYYHPIFAKGDWFDIDDTYNSLVSQFANIILPTYRSRHTQFLLFHFCQSSPELTDNFAGACSHLAFDKNRPQILRLASAAYLASFIARGAHVSPQLVRKVVALLCSHLENLRQSHEYSCTGPNLRRYGAYYGIAQALLYIFCFRWRDLIVRDDDDDDKFDEDLLLHGPDLMWHSSIRETLRRNVRCDLNPLKICSPVIVAQYARIANHLKFDFVFDKIEKNKRVRLSRAVVGGGTYGGYQERETALSAKKGEDGLQLDAYFPFDPYHLPKSKRWLSGDYIEWKDINGSNDDEDDDEESSDDDDELEEDEDDSDSDSAIGGGREDEDAAESFEETATEASA